MDNVLDSMDDIPISSSFTEKVTLPQRSTLRVDNEHTYMIGDLEVRRHNGLFWHLYKKRTCVLLNTGHFLIYSSPFHGLSIYLPALRKVSHRFSGNGGTGSESKARCDVVMCQGHAKLGILIKGQRSLVTAWRRGIVCTHWGLPISEPHLTDELIWMQPTVNPEASESLIYSLANRSLRLNNSMPSLVQTIFASQKKQTGLACSRFQSQRALTMDSIKCTIPHSHSFAATIPSSTHDLTDSFESAPLTVQENHAKDTTFMSDSGVWSPVSDEPRTTQAKTPESQNLLEPKKVVNKSRCKELEGKNWRQLTVAADLPLLTADILNFEAAFSFRNVYVEMPVF
ncbi:hypothetical protein RB195_020502 [Necator americanus]|uniref:DUF7778 domain-containing protein n=1 Tax=Necator americanus TaxID=51031 RepID=A0ABR1CMQ3_NECAM